MKRRKAHLKSRKGCFNCKRLHIKCDELGPPCANCVSRNNSTCTYTNQSSQVAPNRAITPAPPFFGTPDLTTILRLELMHRWSTSSYKAFAVVPPDARFLQIELPRGSLKHDFLLNGILSIAALDIASHQSSYARWAMEFYDAASISFREQVTNVNSENLEFVFLYSHMVALIVPSLSKESAIDTIMNMFDMYIGTALLGHHNMDLLIKSSYAESITYAQERLFSSLPTSLDDETEQAFNRLRKLRPSQAAAPRLFASWEDMYRRSIEELYLCFLEDEKRQSLATCLAFAVRIGPDFMQSVRDREPLALIHLLFLAVLLDRMANVAWWANDLGCKLVAEATTILLRSDCVLAKLPDYHDTIIWAHRQLGTKAIMQLPWIDRRS